MTKKAPERIWGGGRGLPGYITDGPVRGVYDVEYVRADIHQALTAERDALAAEVERLREALVPFVQHLRERPVSDTNAKFVLAPWHMGDGGWLAAMDFYKARAALEEGKDG